jgi:two-component system response regulator AtoC
LESMKRYSWPGNVRELKNLLERTITFNDTGVIQASELEFGEETVDAPPVVSPPPATSPHSLDEMEREHIIRVLRQTRGNKKKAAEILGIERRTLYNKAKRLGIDFSSS